MLNKTIIIIFLLGNLLIFIPKITATEPSDIFFTEIMYDLPGSDDGQEWVEIYNKEIEPITIIIGSGEGSWRFNDGNNHVLSLFQGSEIIAGQAFAIIADDGQAFLNNYPGFIGTIFEASLALGNSLETISLSADEGQTFFNQVVFESLWGANGNGRTLEKIDLNGSNERENWQESFINGGTPGLPASIEPPNQPPLANAGEDQAVNFGQLALFDGSLSVDPDQDELNYIWDFGDNGNGLGVTTTHQYLATGTYAVILTVSDGELEATDDLLITVNAPPNQPPVANAGPDQTALVNQSLVFNGAGSFDPDNDPLAYSWNFGDNLTASGQIASHSFAVAGSYLVTLFVNDGLITSSDYLIVTINLPTPPANNNSNNQDYLNILINEFLPNPAGSDEAEWIELYNNSSVAVNLNSLKIQDNSQASYTINGQDYLNSQINPFSYFIVERVVSGIALNNTGGDCVKLLSSTNVLITQICYSEPALENKSYARESDNGWAWTELLTKSSQNQFSLNQTQGEENEEKSQPGGILTLDNNEGLFNDQVINQEQNAPVVYYSLDEVKSLTKGSKVVLSGIVIVLPGTFSKNYFYLVEVNSTDGEVIMENGLQIYSYKKDFPDLKLGEVVEVRGEVSENHGEKRVKISTSQDVIILQKLALPDPESIEINEINEEMIGGLVKISGDLLETGKTSLKIADSSGEINVFLKGFTTPSNLQPGFTIEVTGLVNQASGGLRLLPRLPSDLAMGEIRSETPSVRTDEKAKEAANQQIIIPKFIKSNIKNYLVIGLILLIIIGLLLIKYKQSKISKLKISS